MSASESTHDRNRALDLLGYVDAHTDRGPDMELPEMERTNLLLTALVHAVLATIPDRPTPAAAESPPASGDEGSDR